MYERATSLRVAMAVADLLDSSVQFSDDLAHRVQLVSLRPVIVFKALDAETTPS